VRTTQWCEGIFGDMLSPGEGAEVIEGVDGPCDYNVRYSF
jgi:hypothetical protein